MAKQLSKVAVVGRANVGKSTLFNRLSSRVKSLTLDYVGVTRDFLTDIVSWKGRSFEFIDTGGVQIKKSDDPMMERVRLKAMEVLQEADLILFVCDGVVGVTPEDQTLARFIHRLKKPTLLLINKSDVKVFQDNVHEFVKLGFKDTVEISAQHGIGTGDLLNEILDRLPHEAEVEEEEGGYKVALLGKPNVGKSSLMNILMEKERSLVADMPGTTREAISDKVRFYQETIELTDTAGVRRKRSVDETIEEMMVKTSFQAVRDADIVLLMLDGSEGKISQQELKLAGFVFDTGKALILVRNKDDLIDEGIKGEWEFDSEQYEYLLKKLEIITISCKTGRNVGKVLPLVQKIWSRYKTHISMSELTVLFRESLERTPLYHKRQRLKLFSAKQIADQPPTIRLNVNQQEWFGDSQKAFFENKLRGEYELKSIPVKFLPRKIKPARV